MKTGSRSNLLLTELLIVILFFLLASAVLVQIFTAARAQSARAQYLSEAVAEAQNVADRLYVSGGKEDVLTQMGFLARGEEWIRDEAGFSLHVRTEREEEDAGTMVHQTVTALSPEGAELLTLPCSRWLDREDAP